MQRLDRMARAR